VSEYLDVGYTQRRLGEKVTELSLTLSYADLPGLDLGAVRLELRPDGGCWTRVEQNPVRRGKDKQMWRVRIVPCKRYSVRVGVQGDGCVEYYQHPTQVGPASAEDIAQSSFRPSPPSSIATASLSSESVLVRWSPSVCAESYSVWYESHDGAHSGNISVTAEHKEVTLTELQSCGDYTVYVSSVLGEEFSDDADAEFATCDATEHDGVNNTTEVDAVCEYVENECGAEKEEDKANTTQKEIETNHEIQTQGPEPLQLNIDTETQRQASQAMSSYKQWAGGVSVMVQVATLVFLL
jgi:hypothetical protein